MTEILIAGLLVVLGIAVVVGSLRMPLGVNGAPGPGLFPLLLATALVIVGGALLVQAGLKGAPQGEGLGLGHRHVLLALGAIAGAALLLERLGFLVTTVVFLGVLFWALATISWWRATLAAIIVALAAQAFFQSLLGVRLPAGLF